MKYLFIRSTLDMLSNLRNIFGESIKNGGYV